jgi:hypothetical protein
MLVNDWRPRLFGGSGQTVTFRLTGLASDTLYRVSVTTVDSSGNESVCSPTASAVAQVDFAVSPGGSVTFGNVSVGSFASQTFTLSNTRGGTVSGTVSVSAPFSVASGSPFTLSGLGATQSITVRFTPTQPAVSSTNISFSADGDTISRLATGTGVAFDATAPTVTITAPTSSPTLSTATATLTLGGTASDDTGVTQVTWGNTGTDTLTVTLTIAFTFTDDPVVARSTEFKAAHFAELRTAVNTLRAVLGLAVAAWTDPTLVPGSTRVRAIHLTELRNALSQAYQAAGRIMPSYTDPLGPTIIRAIHLNELRAAIRAF